MIKPSKKWLYDVVPLYLQVHFGMMIHLLERVKNIVIFEDLLLGVSRISVTMEV